MQRAIYVSDAVGTAGASILSIAQILGASDANNRRDHLTGLMMFHRGQFMQVIEGGPFDLDRLLERLRADPRHTNLRLLVKDRVESRRFGSRPMAHTPLTAEIESILADRRLEALSLAQAERMFLSALEPLEMTG